ncbi:NifU-like protein [Plasmodium gonderi]|uniref:NifU-like protein n=1 Tax=Plasmodium gonderi TaxID=77519 RepID=A0A1Y1JJZ4_PLAGO|nr:NifU-like protein [Plasmodium gonderi]GAW80374.1 NifU-like protein [Plasmodium gonderi]
MMHFKNKSLCRQLYVKRKITFSICNKMNVHFLNYVNFSNKCLATKIVNNVYFSTSKNTDYINFVNEINNFIDVFQKNSDDNSSSGENILSVLQKIKNEKIYEQNEDLMEIISSIKLLIDKRVRPVVVNDGGDIKFICFDVNDGVVYVQLEGACVTCSQSEITLQYMIKNMLTYYISEIKEIKNVSKNGVIL